MLSYFKSLQPSSVIAFLITFLLLKLPFFFIAIKPTQTILNFWTNTDAITVFKSPFLSVFIAQICLLGQAIWINYLFQKADFHEGSSMIPALYFTIISSLFPQFNLLSIYILITFVLLLLLHVFLSIIIKENSKIECFNAGLLCGVLCLLDVRFFIFIPILIWIIYAIKPFKINEYILLVFGLLFTFYIALSLCYLMDISINLSVLKFKLLQFNTPLQNTLNIIIISITLLYLFFSFISLRGILFSTGFKRRKSIKMLVLLFIGAVLIIAISGNTDEAALSVLIIPLSIFFALFMLRIRKKRLGETLNLIFVFVTFITNIVRIFR